MSSTRRARIRSSGSDGRPSSMPTGSANLAGSVPNPVDGDLRGRLSNPPEIAGTLAGQGSVGPRRPRTAVDRTRDGAAPGAPGAVPEQRGRLSNLVQRRLSETAVDAIVVAHTEGTTIDALASRFEVHRTTILHHLDRRGVPRPPSAQDDRSLCSPGGQRYEAGESLKVVGAQYAIDAGTLAREFRRAGVPIRPRRGWVPRPNQASTPSPKGS